MPDISDIIDDEIKSKPKTETKFLWLSLRAWERIALAIIMIVGGLILEQGRNNGKRIDAIESKVGTDQKQWERITELGKDVRENKITITHTSGHHEVIDNDIDSMWLALKSVDIQTAKIAIQSGVNKELLRLIIEENILQDDCLRCQMDEEINLKQPEEPKEAPKPSPRPNAQQQVDALNEFNNRIEQIPEEIDDYKMRQMKR